MAGQEDSPKISRVHRSKDGARRYYDRISVAYDWLGGLFERKQAKKTLSYLNVGTARLSWKLVSALVIVCNK